MRPRNSSVGDRPAPGTRHPRTNRGTDENNFFRPKIIIIRIQADPANWRPSGHLEGFRLSFVFAFKADELRESVKRLSRGARITLRLRFVLLTVKIDVIYVYVITEFPFYLFIHLFVQCVSRNGEQ